MAQGGLVSTSRPLAGWRTQLTQSLIGLLFALLLAWIFHWDGFKTSSPKQDLAFTLVLDTQAKRPDKALYKGNVNQKAGGKRTEDPPKPKVSQVPPHRPAQAKIQGKRLPVHSRAVEKASSALIQPRPTASVTIQKPRPAASLPPEQADEPLTRMPVTTTATPPSETSNPQIAPSTAEGVNVEQDADLGPLLADLKKRINHNWVPPRGSESRKVSLILYLQRDGQLVKVETLVSSGDQNADQAAVTAAEASAPFMALPAQIKEDVLPVEFTFDYNVLNSPKHKQL
jgi:TonB family protein